MKPRIYFVADDEYSRRHRAFSDTQAAFCGAVSNGEGWKWARHFFGPSPLESRNCAQCARSPLNGEVELVGNVYKPLRFGSHS